MNRLLLADECTHVLREHSRNVGSCSSQFDLSKEARIVENQTVVYYKLGLGSITDTEVYHELQQSERQVDLYQSSSVYARSGSDYCG